MLACVYFCRNIRRQLKYKPNKQYNEITACNIASVHRNTAYDNIQNGTEYVECGGSSQGSLYECVNYQD